MKLVEVIKAADGSIAKVLVESVETVNKVKGVIHWVSKEHSLTVKLN